MDASPLSMSGFELVDTPGSIGRSCLSLDEFEDASPLKQTYCRQITEEEYENQGAETTQLALKVYSIHDKNALISPSIALPKLGLTQFATSRPTFQIPKCCIPHYLIMLASHLIWRLCDWMFSC